MSYLQQAIELETVDTLKQRYVTFFAIKPEKNLKAWLAEALAKGLSDPARLKAYLQTLSDLERTFVQETVFNYNGYIERSRFELKYGSFPEKPQKERSWYSSITGPSDSIELFFYHVPPQRYGLKKIPFDLLDLLKQIIDQPEPDTLKTCTLPTPFPEDHHQFERERLALSELHSVLILLQDKQLKASEKTRVASAATIKKVAKGVHEYYKEPSCEDAAGMEFILSYGWLSLIGNSKFSKQSKTTLTPARKTNDSPAETIKAIWDQWVSNKTHDEFRRIDKIKGQNGKGKRFFTNVITRRESIISTLKECEVNTWISIADFSNYLFITGAELEVSTEPHYLYIYNPGYDEFYSGCWELMEARYLRCFLLEYAATLGLIDVVLAPPETDETYYDQYGNMECLSRYDGLRFFRVTPLGAYVLGLTDQYKTKDTATTETSLTIHRQGRIVFDQPPTPWEQRFLSLYADQGKDNVWKLSRKKMMETLQIGGDISELKTFLLAREDQPFLPEDCEGILKQVANNTDGAKIKEEALIVICKNQEIVKLIINDKILSKWCQQLGKRQVVIPKSKEKKFRDSLNSMGIGCS